MKNVLVIPKKKKDGYEIKPVITLICPEYHTLETVHQRSIWLGLTC